MRSTIEQLHENARHHSKRAAELIKRSDSLREEAKTGKISQDEAERRSAELIHRAEEESKQAANMMKFLRSYEKSSPPVVPGNGVGFARSFAPQPA